MLITRQKSDEFIDIQLESLDWDEKEVSPPKSRSKLIWWKWWIVLNVVSESISWQQVLVGSSRDFQPGRLTVCYRWKVGRLGRGCACCLTQWTESSAFSQLNLLIILLWCSFFSSFVPPSLWLITILYFPLSISSLSPLPLPLFVLFPHLLLILSYTTVVHFVNGCKMICTHKTEV